MSQGTMAWWRLGSVFLVVAAAAFATAASEIWESVDTFPDLKLEDKAMSGKWESVPEIQNEAVGGEWVDLYDSIDRRQASDDYDEDDYSDGIAQVGEDYSIKNALKPRSGQKQKCPFTPSPEDVSTTPLPPLLPPVLPPRPPVLPPRPPMTPPRRPMMPPRRPMMPPRRPMMPPRPPVSFPDSLAVPLPPTSPVASTGTQNCAVRLDERVPCGSVTISRTACEAAGCCFESTCFYPPTSPVASTGTQMLPHLPPMMPIGVLPPRPPVLPPRPPVLPPRPPVLPIGVVPPLPAVLPPRPPVLPPLPAVMPPRPPVLPIGVVPPLPAVLPPRPPVLPIRVVPHLPAVLPPRPPMTPPRRPMMPPRPPVSEPLPPTSPVASTGAQNCAVRLDERVPCGSVTISRTACEAAGCCFESTCFFPPTSPVASTGTQMLPPMTPIGVVPHLPAVLPPHPPVLPPLPAVLPPRPPVLPIGVVPPLPAVLPPRPPVLPIGVVPHLPAVLPPRPPVLPPRPPMTPPRRPMMPPRPPPVSFPDSLSVPLPPPVYSTRAQNCAVLPGQRVSCGSVTISPTACEAAGCCFDSTCFYPMNECTKDEHFVFVINRDAPKRDSVDPTGLVIPSAQACRPVIVDSMYAIFKFSIHECGTHYYQVGGTKVYLAEVFTPITTMSLKYGVITRSTFVRFLFECRYDVGGPVSQTSLFSIGYMVKTPLSSFPSQIISDGLFAIQLRIAREQTFTSWVDDHLPLRELVNGEPVYLEVRLRSPKPKAVLLVNYCIAYTRYATNALVIIYEGCENPLDDTVAILRVTEANRYTRRFKVDAFQFMDLRTSKFIDEDIYFMCSTELCMPLERQCEERCFDGKQRTLQ